MTRNGKFLPAVTDITLDDCMLQCGKVPAVEDWYENQFYYVMGEMEDYDFFLATCLVVFKGPPGGGYKMVEDGVMNHTHFFMLPKEMRGRMLDNDFIAGDANPWQFLKGSDLAVTREEDRVVWSAAGRELIARPPYWEIRGTHKGIEMDLVIHSICPGFWYLGHFKDIAQNMSAGVDEFTQAEGTLTVGGKKYEIAHAGGLYEHVALPGWDQVDIVSRGRYLWMVGWSEDIQIFVFYMPGLNNFTGHVIVDGKPTSYYGAGQVIVDERGTWADPRSSMLTACQWHVRLISEEAVLDVVVNNGGRSFSVNTFSNGHLGRYQNLAFATGNFTFADGRTIPIEDVRMGVDRTLAFNILR